MGTTFAILAIGFGGGLLLAKSALHDSPNHARASSDPSSGMRVILPASAAPALQVTAVVPTPEPPLQPAQELQTAANNQVEKADPKKPERDLKAERRRQAERKARRMAADRARQRTEPQMRQGPGIMALGGDESHVNFFRN